MHTISSTIELKEAIKLLEEQQVTQGSALKKHFAEFVGSIRPVNILRSTFSQIASSSDLAGNMLSAAVALIAGYFSNKSLVGSSGNLLRKFLGAMVQFGITSLIMKNPEAIRSAGQSILHRIFKSHDK